MKILIGFILLAITNNSIAKDVNYYNYTFTIPDDFIEKHIKNLTGIYVLNKNKKAMISVNYEIPSDKNFYQLEDYDMTGSSYRKLFNEIFGSHKTENKYILEARGFNKNRKDIEITDRAGFRFYRQNNSNAKNKTHLIISTPIKDEVISMYFTDLTNKTFIKSVMDSLRINTIAAEAINQH